MNEPLDQIRFLSASENRVRVLEYLYETSADRRELNERTGVSRPTLSRVLSGLEERGWITQRGSECEITPLGEHLVEEFTSLVDTVETLGKLEAVVDYLPMDEVDFELSRLGDATVTRPTRTDPNVTLRRATELVRGADEFRFLTNTVVTPVAEVLRERTSLGDLTVVGVITDELFETVRTSPTFRTLTLEMVESGHAELYRYDGNVARTLALADDTTATITQVDADGYQRAHVETEDEAVRSWVATTIERYRRRSERITPEMLAG